MQTLYVTRGLPGCGKTTRARRWVAEDSRRRARVNRDDLREHLFSRRTGIPEHEQAVTLAQHAAIRALLAGGYDVVADDTNLSPKTLAELGLIAEQAGAAFVIWDMTDVPIDTCINRDAVRAVMGERHVGEDVIRTMNSRWLYRGEPR